MGEFKVIETQEDFDAAIEGRLKDERDAVEKKYEGYLSPDDAQKKYQGFLSPEAVQEKYKDYLTPEQAKEKDNLIKGYEKKEKKIQIALSEGIPFELAEKISGETEEDMRKDAKTIAGFMKKSNPYPEYRPGDDNIGSSKKEAMKKMLNNLKGE